jgi:ribosomal protein S18 acetylase RimI-like enzyme
MITISKSSWAGVKQFVVDTWKPANRKYYSDNGEWEEKKFYFKAEENGEIVGSIYGKFDAGVLYIDDLIVAENKRGLGIGKALMQKAEDFGMQMKAHKLYLITGKTWTGPRGLYESLGYIQTGEFLNHYKHTDFVIYEKLLQ